MRFSTHADEVQLRSSQGQRSYFKGQRSSLQGLTFSLREQSIHFLRFNVHPSRVNVPAFEGQVRVFKGLLPSSEGDPETLKKSHGLNFQHSICQLSIERQQFEVHHLGCGCDDGIWYLERILTSDMNRYILNFLAQRKIAH